MGGSNNGSNNIPGAVFAQNMWQNFLRDKQAMAGLLIVLLFLAVGLLAPLIAPHDPLQIDLANKLLPPSLSYPLGTDHLGRCELSRLIYATRVSLSNSILVLALILLISIPVGSVSGYAGGAIDNILMRITDILLAFPSLVLSLAIAGLIGPSLAHLLIALAAVLWAGYARIIRGMVLQIKEKEFITAARASGASHFNVVTRHIMLHAMTPIIALAALEVGGIILAISGLCFLGLGAQPPTPEWGVMLNDSRPYIQSDPNLMLYPGLAIFLVVGSFNLVGEGLRKAINPQSGGRMADR